MEIDLMVAYVAAGVAFITALVTSFVGPFLLEQRKQIIEEKILWGPSKEILQELLDNAANDQGRSFKTLKRVTGLQDHDIRRLLIGLGARGFTRDSGDEAWCYKYQRPLQKQLAHLTKQESHIRYLIMAMRTPQFQQTIIEPHMQYLEKLREQGVLELAGPFADKTGGAYLVTAENWETAQAIALNDPFHTSGSFVLTVYEWQTV